MTKYVTYFKDNIHHLVRNVIPYPLQPKLPKNRGSNLSGKQIRLVEAMTPILEREVKEHKDESEATKAIVVGRDLQRIQRYRVMIHAERVQVL